MQIVNGKPVFDSTDVIYSHDDQNAFDGQGNIMGLWSGLGGGMGGNPLNTDQTSFLDYLRNNNGAGLAGGIKQQRQGNYLNSSLTGENAQMWGGADNPYYNFMLQMLTGGKTRQYSPVPQQQNYYSGTPSNPGTGAGGYGGGTEGAF